MELLLRLLQHRPWDRLDLVSRPANPVSEDNLPLGKIQAGMSDNPLTVLGTTLFDICGKEHSYLRFVGRGDPI